MKLYRKLDRSLYQMDFCVNIAKEGFYDQEILKMGGKIFHIPSKSENLQEFKKQLTDIVKSEHYEYVLRITSNTMGFMDLKIAKKAGAKICISRSSNSNDSGGIKAKIAHAFGKILYTKYVDIKIAPSDLAAIHTFGSKAFEKGEVNILKNAIDFDIYKYSELDRKRIRNELNIENSDLVIGHIGRFYKQKNHELLIDIFADICKKKNNAKLFLIGEGELENQIRKKCKQYCIEDKVLFLGIRSDIPALLSAMDIFVFPSLYEGMPNTIIEAQATGLPCVISNTITRETGITQLVHYCGLGDSTESWSKTILSIKDHYRDISSVSKLKDAGYDIVKVVVDFENLVFHD